MWEKETTDPDVYRANFSVSINEQQLHTREITIDFQGHQRQRSIVAVQGIVLPQPGQAIFRLAVVGGPEATCTFNIQAVQTAIRAE
jgi:hypothetical protein